MTVANPPRDRVTFFAMLADGEHPIELRCRISENEWRKHWASTPEQADRLAHAYTRAGQDAYVGVLPRLGRVGSEQRQYAPARVLWADCDSTRAVEKLAAFEPEPTMVVLSGGRDGDTLKRHAYWRLTKPLLAATVPLHARRLARHLEADMASTDAARILRVPGSRHHGTGRVATLERFTGEAYTLAELTGDLPDPPGTGAGYRAIRQAKTTDELVELFRGHYADGEGRHEHFRSICGVLLARCDRLPPDVLLELAVAWAQMHTKPCKDRAELERNFDNLLRRERKAGSR